MRLPTRLLQRKANCCKNDFGHIFILAGSSKYLGAASLCAESAMRSGAGLVTLAVPKSLNCSLIRIKTKEVMTLPLEDNNSGYFKLSSFKQIVDFLKRVDVVALGPGLDQNKSTRLLVHKLIPKIDKPLVIDADGLNMLTSSLKILKKDTILTPHPKEMARLSGISVDEIQENRRRIAVDFSNKFKITVVLKGNRTIVCDYKGNLYVNRTGNPGMATAGSGDVLTGMIAAFLGQGLGSFEAAKIAVYLHGLAGDLAAKEKTEISLIASDIIDKIPCALSRYKCTPA